MTEAPRLFVAVPLPDDARAAIEALVAQVRAVPVKGREVRWVRMDGLHLTLRFLGPTPVGRVGALAEAVTATAAVSPPIAFTIGGAGAFPSHGRPRALWLGIATGAAELAALAVRLDNELEARGWPRSDRPFRPHLTLARSDGVRAGSATAAALIDAAATLSVEATADRLVLFESRTGGGPARYEPVHGASIETPAIPPAGSTVLPSGCP